MTHRREPAAEIVVAKEKEEEKELRTRLQTVEQELEKIEEEVEILKAQSRMIIQANRIGFLDQFYVRAGLALIVPRARTFTFQTDTGLGAFVGIGHYFGRNHVLDLGFAWDLYPSLSLEYRYEVHGDTPGLTWGPVFGYKTKAAPARPFDNYLADPDAVENSFLYFGAILGFPMAKSMLTVQFLYLVNTQAFLMMNCGVHFFL